MRLLAWTLLAISTLVATGARRADAGQKWSGFLALESRWFPAGPLFAEQSFTDVSVVFQPEYSLEWDGGRQDLVVTPFVRLDAQDPERTHFDLRELTWRFAAERWEIRAGFRKVFWGVVESHHLVDFINQTDLVENVDGEQKLGQPMVNFAWIDSWGTLDAFLLLGFRERTFPGSRGRLRAPLPVDTERTRYESSAGKNHLDWALRWTKSLGLWDVGIAHFSGTSRDPLLVPTGDRARPTSLVPVYELASRTSVDLQLTAGNALYKLEAVRHSQTAETYLAAVGGIEYTFYGALGTRADVGVLAEYLVSQQETSSLHPFEDDLFLGTRIQLNDVDGTHALFGVTIDRTSGATFVNFEASRRIGSRLRLEAHARAFVNVPETDRLYFLRADDYLGLRFAWHF